MLLLCTNQRLGELKSGKQKMSRQLRENEEELESLRQRIETLQQDARKLEKAKREVSYRLNFWIC